MKYFDDFRSKAGFSDGEMIPVEAAETREIYVQVINEIAKRNGSKCRAVIWDRAGMHNPYHITFASYDDIVGCGLNPIELHLWQPQLEELINFPEMVDGYLTDAVSEARGLDLDDLLYISYISVEIDHDGLNEILKEAQHIK